MKKSIYILISILVAFLPFKATTQGIIIGSQCFDKSLDTSNTYTNDTSKIFTKTLHYPYFKEGDDAFVAYLLSNINIGQVSKTINTKVRDYYDTARVGFSISKNGIMSNLTVSSNNPFLSDQIYQAIKSSSCNWVPGGTERLLNVWHRFEIYYTIEKRYNELSVKIKIKDTDG